MKSYIWTLQTRLFHWLLAISFALAFILGGENETMNWHAALGVFVGMLIIFRMIQGFTGPRYTRFSDFPITPAAIKLFITSMKKSKSEHPGHNPMASFVMLFIILTAFMSALSGMLIFASAETGILGFRISGGASQEQFKEFHEVVVHLCLILVGIHLTGVVFDALFNRKNGTIWSIFTGYKNIKAPEPVLSGSQKIFTAIWFALSLTVFVYVRWYQAVPAGEKEHTEQDGSTDKEED